MLYLVEIFLTNKVRHLPSLVAIKMSIGMHAIPSNEDAKNVFEEAKVHVKSLNVLALVTFPIVFLIYIFNALRINWADLAYGVAIGIWLPSVFFE